MWLVAVAGSSGLTAHSRPSIGRGFVDGIGCNRLATMFTLARTFRLLICASSRAFFTFANEAKVSTFFGDIRPHFCFVQLRWCLSRTYGMSSQEKKIICSPVNNVFLLCCTQRTIVLECIMLHAQCVH